MNEKESRSFLRGQMEFTPQRMMRYIRSRARLATDEDVEDILQNSLVLVTKHFDPTHPEAKLAPYCLGACNKAIAQNLERYHKVQLRKREDKKVAEQTVEIGVAGLDANYEGESMTRKQYGLGKTFSEESSNSTQWRTTSLDSMFDAEDGRTADDVFGMEYNFMSGNSEGNDPASRAMINDLIDQILAELPEQIHRTCFVLKYVEGYKREDLISCLKMDPKSIDTIDKKISRTLKAFKEKLDKDEARI